MSNDTLGNQIDREMADLAARCSTAERELEVASDTNTTLKGRLVTASKQIDERDQRLHLLEEEIHIYTRNRERIFGLVELLEHIVRLAKRNVMEIGLQDEGVRNGEDREEIEAAATAELPAMTTLLRQLLARVDAHLRTDEKLGEPADIACLRRAGVEVRGNDEPYLVGNIFNFSPSTKSWKRVDGGQQGYGWRNLVQAIRDLQNRGAGAPRSERAHPLA
jgi:hypothetical protein